MSQVTYIGMPRVYITEYFYLIKVVLYVGTVLFTGFLHLAPWSTLLATTL